MPALLLGLALLTLTALYLIGPGWNAMDGGTTLILLLHIGLGLVLIVPVALVLARKMRQSGKSGRVAWSGVALLAGICAATGLALFLRAMFGVSTARDVSTWWLHLLTGFMAFAAVVGMRRLRRTLRKVKPQDDDRQRAMPALAFWMLFAPFTLWTTAALPKYSPDDYYRDLTATNAAQAQNPHFPAGVQLVGGAAEEWRGQSAAYCGRAGCHVRAYREWLPSGHHFAGTDPFYLQIVSEYAVHSGADATRWCQGCHDPIQALAYHPSLQVGRAAGGEGKNAGSGVDCVVCHAIIGTPTRTGNGHFTLSLPGDYPYAGQGSGRLRRLHDFLLRVRPGPHQRAYLKPTLLGSAEFCSSCHRQSFNVPQNHYQFVRGPDTYGEWLSGPYSGRAVRAPGPVSSPPQTCQDCHFPRRAGTVSHAALGANTAVPALQGGTDHVAQTEAFLRDGRVTLDLFALRRKPPQAGRPEEWIAPLDGGMTAVRPGETVTLDIVVSNRGIGHSFPSGYEDIKDAWLEVTLADERGRRLLGSGILASDADPLPPDTHAYRLVALDRAGNVITRHNLTDMVTTVYRRVLLPGSSDIARYTFRLPDRNENGEPLRGPLRLSARLRYRSIRPDADLTPRPPSLNRSFLTGKGEDQTEGFSPPSNRAGTEAKEPALTIVPPFPVRNERFREGGRGVRSPITTLAEVSVVLPFTTDRTSSFRSRQDDSKPERAARFVQYGVGLMAPTEGADLPRAIRAFQRAQKLAPDDADAWLGLGRAYLHEVALLAARTQFEGALRRAPGSPAARAYLGIVAGKQGEYDQALRQLKPLAEQFPEDNILQFDLGQVLFQLGNYEEAAAAFRRALAADPEDAAAHYQLKRCYQHLRRVPEARREEAIGRYLAEDRLASQLLPLYRRAHPEDTLATQSIPVHTLRPPGSLRHSP